MIDETGAPVAHVLAKQPGEFIPREGSPTRAQADETMQVSLSKEGIGLFFWKNQPH